MKCQGLYLGLKFRSLPDPRNSPINPDDDDDDSFYLLSNYYALNTSVNAFYSYNNSMTWVLLLFSFSGWGNWVTKNLNNFPGFSFWPGNGETGIRCTLHAEAGEKNQTTAPEILGISQWRTAVPARWGTKGSEPHACSSLLPGESFRSAGQMGESSQSTAPFSS